MKFQIMTTFWNEPYNTWFKTGCFKSMTWPRNKKAIYENCSMWNVNTDEKHFPEIMELFESEFPGLKVKLRSTTELRRYVDVLQSALVIQIKECLETKDKFLFAPPDTIFADGTIENIVRLGQEEKSGVAIAHARVLPKILDELNKTYSSPDLVSLAWKHLHRSWTDAKVNHPRQSSFMSGVSWEEIDKNLFSVTHRLPTTYFVDFIPEDLNYFKTCIGFGDWDHVWASRLYEMGRQRYVGSSDAGFIVELTEPTKNVPPVRPGDLDGFWKNDLHNHINKQTRVIFRGSP